jgi:hypothetical protein
MFSAIPTPNKLRNLLVSFVMTAIPRYPVSIAGGKKIAVVHIQPIIRVLRLQMLIVAAARRNSTIMLYFLLAIAANMSLFLTENLV